MNYAKCLSILYLFLFVSSNSYSIINNYNIDDSYDNVPDPATISNIEVTNNSNNDKEEKNPRGVINKFNNNKENTEEYKLLELRKKTYQASQINNKDKKLFNMMKSKIKPNTFSTQIALYKNSIINKHKESNNKDTSNIHTIPSIKK